ncbi:NAD-dependent epimerase/dehydratase family protein [Allochromatium vinosum]|uniref:NAD-dependent epimerase/dehydratase n=1 Tax=Allochromatium vinosum (strain ATCC 17899 / DSM 180 / NBRC 103801 / NCIMB 10441 / D) TaxID=572477 RepID=D3RUX4_ALLVD|nr:NAD-dependent epimerase/dehydratase family protein [Allochromatium vinosum]ADC61023.1 NAD-dependent epimerase/dehydratase [Allochromatium vinosum DSM 180]
MTNTTQAAHLGPVLVTGATGQVGRRLVSALLETGHPVTILTRSPAAARRLWPSDRVAVHAGDLTEAATLAGLGEGLKTVFHLASYAPRPDEPDLYNAPDHWRVTAEGTANLVAALTGSTIERLVYVSTVKAMGDRAGALGRPAGADTPPEPDCLYGRAKLAAEHSVLEFGRAHRTKVSVMRLPMVYGLDGAGNIVRMVEAVATGRFPPWPHQHNRRSAIHVEDAIAAALLIARHPETGDRTYIATDGQPYSTRWIYEQIRLALGQSVPRWTLPLWILQGAALGGTLVERGLGQRMPLTRDSLAKLTQDAWYDSSAITALGFVPRQGLMDEIKRLTRRSSAASAP